MRGLIFNNVTSTTILEMGGGIYDMPAGFSYIQPKDILHKASSHGAILSCNCLKIKGGGILQPFKAQVPVQSHRFI